MIPTSWPWLSWLPCCISPFMFDWLHRLVHLCGLCGPCGQPSRFWGLCGQKSSLDIYDELCLGPPASAYVCWSCLSSLLPTFSLGECRWCLILVSSFTWISSLLEGDAPGRFHVHIKGSQDSLVLLALLMQFLQDSLDIDRYWVVFRINSSILISTYQHWSVLGIDLGNPITGFLWLQGIFAPNSRFSWKWEYLYYTSSVRQSVSLSVRHTFARANIPSGVQKYPKPTKYC